MAKVKTFSRVFPSYHPRAGESTYFVEKIHYSIWSTVDDEYIDMIDFIRDANKHLSRNIVNDFIDSLDMETRFEPKHHTIRAGNHFKVGDWFSPRVWSGKPYRSKQIIIGPDIQVKKVWDFEINDNFTTGYAINKKIVTYQMLKEIAKNDGLYVDDLECWFNKHPFSGQIICWNDKNIKYQQVNSN